MADKSTTLIPSSEVKGNITSCKIDNQVKSVQKDSVWSFQQHTTYVTYDVCNKNILAEYTTPGVAFGGVFLISLSVLIVSAVLIGAIKAFKGDSYY